MKIAPRPRLNALTEERDGIAGRQIAGLRRALLFIVALAVPMLVMGAAGSLVAEDSAPVFKERPAAVAVARKHTRSLSQSE